MDCSLESWVSHHGVVLLSHLLRFSLEREADLPVGSQSAPPSARASNIDGFLWVIDELVRDMLGTSSFFFFAEGDVFLGDMGVHSRADGYRVRISQVADDEVVSGVSVGFTHTTCSLAPKEFLMLVVTGPSLLETGHTALLEIPN